MADEYDAERVEGMKTLGDSLGHFRRDPDAFIAGAHCVLDVLMSDPADISIPIAADHLRWIKARREVWLDRRDTTAAGESR